MGAWDIESGRKAYFILDAHDGEEITCISIDRLLSKNLQQELEMVLLK